LAKEESTIESSLLIGSCDMVPVVYILRIKLLFICLSIIHRSIHFWADIPTLIFDTTELLLKKKMVQVLPQITSILSEVKHTWVTALNLYFLFTC